MGGGFDTGSVDIQDAFELFNQIFGNRGFAESPLGRMHEMHDPFGRVHQGFSNFDFDHLGGNQRSFHSSNWGSSGGVSRSETISTTTVNGRSVTKRVVTENGKVVRSEILKGGNRYIN